MTTDELRSVARTALRLALAYRAEAELLRVRDEAYWRRGTLRRLEEDHLLEASKLRAALLEGQKALDAELQDLRAKAFPQEGGAS